MNDIEKRYTQRMKAGGWRFIKFDDAIHGLFADSTVAIKALHHKSYGAWVTISGYYGLHLIKNDFSSAAEAIEFANNTHGPINQKWLDDNGFSP